MSSHRTRPSRAGARMAPHVAAPRLGASNDWIRPGSPAVRKWPSKCNDNSAPVLSSDSAPVLGIASAAQVRKAVASVTSRDDTALLRVRRESATRGPGRYLGPTMPLSAREQRDLRTSSAVFVQPTPERRKPAEPAPAMIWTRVNGPVEYRDPTDRTSIRVTHDRSPHRYASVFGMQTRRSDPAARVTTHAAVGPGRYDASADGLSIRVTDSARESAQFRSLTGRSTDAVPSKPSTAPADSGRRTASRLDIVRTLEEDPRPELASGTLKKGPTMLLTMSESCVSVVSSHRPTTNRGRRAGGDCSQRKQHRSRAAPFGSKGPRFVRPRSCMEAWEAHEGQLRRVDQSGYVGPGAYEPDLQRREQVRPSSSFSAQPRGELFPTRTPALAPDLGRWPLGTTGSRELVFRESVFVD